MTAGDRAAAQAPSGTRLGRRARLPRVETLMLAPAAVALVLATIDFVAMGHARAELARAAQAAARAVAQGRATPGEAAEWASARLENAALPGGALCVLTGDAVKATASAPMAQASVFGVFQLLAPERLSAAASAPWDEALRPKRGDRTDADRPGAQGVGDDPQRAGSGAEPRPELPLGMRDDDRRGYETGGEAGGEAGGETGAETGVETGQATG